MFKNLEKRIMELLDTFLQVHEHFMAVFNVIQGLPKLIHISMNVNMGNLLGTQTLLQHIFQLIFGQIGTRQFHLLSNFFSSLLTEKKFVSANVESLSSLSLVGTR